MADTVIHYRFLVRGGTAADLATVNEIPMARELVVEVDSKRMKLGDGIKRYNDLSYISGAAIITLSAPPTAATGNDGEYAIWPNSGNPILYGPKVNGAWPAGVSLKGPQGERGPAGATGGQGPQGLSAYQVAVANGFPGTQPQWLASLKGEKGDRGEQGPAGISADRRVQVIADSGTGTVECDWDAYDEIRVTVTTDTTFTFSGARNGQGCMLKIRQDSAGGHTIALPVLVMRFNLNIPSYNPSLGANVSDLLGFRYDGTDSRYDLIALTRGIPGT